MKNAKNAVLILIVVGLIIMPFFTDNNAEFSGADGQAEKVITEMQSDYKPWFSPIWEPPSAEIESLLFALQAAVGAGVIGYYIGYCRGRKRKEDTEKS